MNNFLLTNYNLYVKIADGVRNGQSYILQRKSTFDSAFLLAFLNRFELQNI